jgi:hypothetical protein
VLACQASSVPCERLFSGTKQTATDRRALLGNQRFEELTVMKFAWKMNLWDLAAWNSVQIEDIQMMEFEEMLVDDDEEDKWLQDNDLESHDNDLETYDTMPEIYQDY